MARHLSLLCLLVIATCALAQDSVDVAIMNEGSFCYFADGGNECNPTLTWFKGTTYNLNVASVAAHPVWITLEPEGVGSNPYANASPNTISGVVTGTITVTIPSTETASVLYIHCTLHNFFATVNLVADPNAGSTGSATGSSDLQTNFVITSGANASTPCYYLDGGNECNPSMSLVAGGTYTLQLLNVASAHPLSVLTSASAPSSSLLYSRALNNFVDGLWGNATITLTIPLTETLPRLYLWARPGSFFILVNITGARTKFVITAGSMANDTCYYFDGGNTCNPPLSLSAGGVFTLSLLNVLADHGMVVTTRNFNITSDALYAGASPNLLQQGAQSGNQTILLSIPLDETLRNLYLWSFVNNFYTTINITDAFFGFPLLSTGGFVASSTGGSLPPNTYVITAIAGTLCYYVNGNYDLCNPELTMAAGNTYTLNLNALPNTFPMVILTDTVVENQHFYEGANLNPLEGTSGTATITLTIPINEQAKNIFLLCVVNGFYVNITVTGALPNTGGSDVVSSTGTIIDDIFSTGGMPTLTGINAARSTASAPFAYIMACAIVLATATFFLNL